MEKLFLLDAYALIYRAYYALIRSPRVTSGGFNTSAIFGFCNTLDDLLRKEKPTHMAVCFDPPGGDTFRHDLYPEYKAQRDKQPEDITNSIPYIKRILAAYHIPIVEVEGYEADDVIGTLSREAEREGFETYMMTPDKDYGQLVTDRVFMYRPALRGEGFEIRGPKQVCERYGIERPSQVIDLLALEGDSSDNIPGCPGIGEKTAQKLIAEWGDVENLLAHVSEIKGANGRKLTENADLIRLCRTLVTIRTDVSLPAGVTPEAFRRSEPDVAALGEIYKELEFRSFLNKLRQNVAESTPAGSHETPAEGTMGSLFEFSATGSEMTEALSPLACPEGDYDEATSREAVEALVKRALGSPMAGVSVAAIGEEAMTANLEGIAVSTGECRATYIPIPGPGEEREKVLGALKPLFGRGMTIASTDVKRDMVILHRYGVEWDAPAFDTAVAHYLLDAEGRHTPAFLMSHYLKLETPLLGIKPQNLTAANRVDLSRQLADVALRLHGPLTEAIAKEGMTALLNEIEMPLTGVLASMEWTGVRIDPGELATLRDQLTERLDALEKEAFELAGVPFNIGSPSQVGDILFNRLQLDPKAKKTSRGAFSTTEKILEKYRGAHPLVDLILKIRKLRKLVATYLDPLPTLINPTTGRVHTTFNQTVTATGRISSTNPNLQNIPIRTEDGREIRRAFIADGEDDVILSADYSQIELRLIADLSKDPDMTAAFLSGDDIHRATAAKIYHVALEDVTEDQRRNAKTANFGTIYGISAFGLSERLAIPRAEAKMLIEGYFRTYPHIREYIDNAIAEAKERGYVETAFGRRRNLPDINSRNAVVRGYAERNAVNAPLQGTAADIIKIAMVDIHGEIKRRGLRSRMIMQVHDELIFNVPKEELDEMRELVASSMEGAWNGRIPLIVSMGTGHDWLSAHS